MKRSKHPAMELLKIVLGGAAGLGIALVILSFFRADNSGKPSSSGDNTVKQRSADQLARNTSENDEPARKPAIRKPANDRRSQLIRQEPDNTFHEDRESSTPSPRSTFYSSSSQHEMAIQVVGKQQWAERNPAIPLIASDQGFAFLTLLSAANHRPPAGEARLFVDDQNDFSLEGSARRFFRMEATVVSAPQRPWFSQPVEKQWQRSDEVPSLKLIHKNDGFCVLSTIGGLFKDRSETVRVRVKEDLYWHLEGRSSAAGTRAGVLIYQAKEPGSFRAEIQEYQHTKLDDQIRTIHSSEGFCYLSGFAGTLNGSRRKKWVEIGDDGYWYVRGIGQGGKGAFDCWATSIKF